MTSLERRALFGDAEAQRQCTEKGIMLPCPFCGGAAMIEYGDIMPFEYSVFCGDCGVMPSTSEDKQVAVSVWNTRQAPPIGRCVECAYSGNWTDNQAICDLNNGDIVDPDFFAVTLSRMSVKKMSEHRLIDANAEAAWAAENIPEPHSSVVIQFLRDCGTIDPETLPIVQELREKLERVKAERDTAVEQLHGKCYACKHNDTPFHSSGQCEECKYRYYQFEMANASDNWAWNGTKKEE